MCFRNLCIRSKAGKEFQEHPRGNVQVKNISTSIIQSKELDATEKIVSLSLRKIMRSMVY